MVLNVGGSLATASAGGLPSNDSCDNLILAFFNFKTENFSEDDTG